MKLAFIHVRKNAGTSIIDFFDRAGVDLTLVDNVGDARGCVTVAVSRNPYTRCLSAWKYCSSTKNRPLLDCLANPPTPDQLDTDKTWLSRGHDYRHFTKTQSQFMFHGNLRPAHILRYELLEDDLEILCDTYKIPFVLLNKLNTGLYNHTLSNQEREAIYQFYKEDFDNLGYEK